MPDNFIGQDFSGIMSYWPGNQYPVGAKDLEGREGAHKRFVPLPSVQDLRDVALIGLKRLSPEGYAEITDSFLEHYLLAAMSELEMKYNMCLTPTEFFEAFDYVDGMFSANFLPMKLKWWPSTAVLYVQLKFSHAMSSNNIITYEIPPGWVALQSSGKVNVLADFGVVGVVQKTGDGAIFGGLLSFLRGPYRPASLEIRYRAGFDNDQVPAALADLVLTLASLRLLADIGPILFPYTSTSVSIDGVTQSTGLPGPSFLMQRIQLLQVKFKQVLAAVRAQYGKTIMTTFIGA